MNRKVISLVAAAIAAVVAVVLVLQPHESDQVLIDRALHDAIEAGRMGESGPVLDFISGKAKVNGGEVVASRTQIATFIAKNRPDVELGSYEPKISGDEATLSTSCKMTFRLLSLSKTIKVDRLDVKLTKEPSTKWGILPDHRWRVSEVSSQTDLASELSGIDAY